MAETVRLTVLTGPHKGNRYCFRKTGQLTLGRSSDCEVCVCGSGRDQLISRRHCQLSFEPPIVNVIDLCSSNGTYVNGIFCRPPIAAKDGDVLTIGGTSMGVNIVECKDWDESKVIKENCPTKC